MKDFFSDHQEYIKQIDKIDEKVKQRLKNELSEYNKESLLGWLSATSILPGNELFENRFMLLLLFVLSIPSPNFKNKQLSQGAFEEILEKTNQLNWEHYEDYEPILNSNKNFFGFDGITYNFLASSLEIPENYLEKVVTRYFEFEKPIKEKFGYSIKDEFIKILNYQTLIIKFIEKNKDLCHKSVQFMIPQEMFVVLWEDFNKNNYLNSKILSADCEIFEPSNIIDSKSFFISSPIVLKRVITPYILLIAFDLKVVGAIKDNINETNLEIIESQLRLKIFSSLIELVPKQAIPIDFTINDSLEKIDFGFVFDNKIFLFLVFPEKFQSSSIDKRIQEKLQALKGLQSELKRKNVTIRPSPSFHIGPISVKGPLDPIMLIILDDFDSSENKRVMIKPVNCKNTFLSTPSALCSLFEDLFDNERTPIFLSKVMEIYHSIKMLTFSFDDFYFFVSHQNADNLSKIICGNNILFISPQTASEGQRRIINSTRPKLDLRPFDLFPPFSFKIRKEHENLFYGYRRLEDMFFYYTKIENLQVYVFVEKEMYKKEDLHLQNFLSYFFSYSLEQILNDVFEPNQQKLKIVLQIVPYYWAKENLALPPSSNSCGILSNEEHTEFTFMVDFNVIFDSFELNSMRLLDFLINNIFKDKLDGKQLQKVKENFRKFNPNTKFKISKVPTLTNLDENQLLLPSELDLVYFNLELAKNFKGKIKSGVYTREEAKKIVNEIYAFLLKRIDEHLKNYELESFMNFFYGEIENCLRNRIAGRISLAHAQEMNVEYDALGKARRNEYSLESYTPACTFMLEYALFKGITGKERISISDWNSLAPFVTNALSLVYISDFLYYLPDFFNIKLKIDFDNKAIFDISIDQNPLDKYVESSLNRVIEDKSSFFPKVNDKPKDTSFNHFEKIFGETKYHPVNDALLKVLGFKLVDFVKVRETLLNISIEKENIRGLSHLNINEVIKDIGIKTKLSEDTIIKVLSFSTLYSEIVKEDSFDSRKVSTRKNRLLMKPLVKLGDNLIFGTEILAISNTMFIIDVIGGKWPYKQESDEIDLALKPLSIKAATEFENAVFDEIIKYSEYHEINLCENKKNNKCFKQIVEPCPGQIDALSVHVDKKIIIIWEAKDFSSGVGSREIVGDIDEFTRKKGYIEKILKKEDFVRKNIKSVLEYYKIPDVIGWKVISCFVLSENSVVINILSDKCNIIPFGSIKKFIDNH